MNSMDPTNRISTQYFINSLNGERVLQFVDTKLEEASKTNNRLEKRDYYNAAFKELASAAQSNEGKLPSELMNKLFTVLNAYAQSIFYGEEQVGFENSAALAELTLCLEVDQLKDFNFLGSSWTNFSTVEEFMQSSSLKGTEFLDSISLALQDAFNPSLSNTAQNELFRTSVFKTVERLAYSYQNIPEYNQANEKNRELHTQLDVLAYAIMTTDVRLAIDYEYNRAVFSVNLRDANDIDQKLDNLDLVQAKFMSLDPENSYTYGSNVARVLNLKGVILDKINPEKSKKYVDQAFDIRVKMNPPEDKQRRWSHFFLLTNIYSGKIVQALSNPLTKEEFLKNVLPLAVLMQRFIDSSQTDNIHHAYFGNHQQIINVAGSFIDKLGVTQAEMDAVSKELTGRQWY